MHDESYSGFTCEICRKVLHTKGSLTRHMLVFHSDNRPFGCTICSKSFKTKKDLKVRIGYGLFTFKDPDSDSNPDSNPIPVVGRSS